MVSVLPDPAAELPWRLFLQFRSALAAEYRPALSRFEGYRGFPAALGASGYGLRLAGSRGRTTLALILAVLAPFGFVLEVLVVEEVLFSRREYEFCSAVYTLEAAVLEIRHNSLSPMSTWIVADYGGGACAPPPGFTLPPGVTSSGFVCEPAPAWPGASLPASNRRNAA